MTLPYETEGVGRIQPQANSEGGSNAYQDMQADANQSGIAVPKSRMPNAEALVYEHPDYTKNISRWRKYNSFYEAENIYAFIHKHLRETDTMFQQRLKRGYFYNYTSAVVDTMVSYLFHSPIMRDFKSQDDLFSDLLRDADRAGTKYVNLIMQIATAAQIDGHCGVLVDAPKAPAGSFTNDRERKEAGITPYLTIIRAGQIIDWQVDRFGQFTWVKIETYKEQERDFQTTIDMTVRTFLIWTRDTWEEWEVRKGAKPQQDTARLIDSQKHDLGRVPLVIVRNERMLNHAWFGLSAVRDIADINQGILNWSSMGDEEIFERCLNVLAMELDEGAAPAQLSHHNILEYAPGTHPPQYLIPGGTPLEMIGHWIDRAKDEIYRLAKLGGSVGQIGTKQATSGIAYAFEFNETNQALSKKAEGMEQAEHEIFSLVAAWQGEDFEGLVTYPREFGVEDMISDFQVLAAARMNLTSETAMKSLEKRITSKIFYLEDSDFRKKIMDEVDSAEANLPALLPLVPPQTNTPPQTAGGGSLNAKEPEKAKKSSQPSATGSKTSTGGDT